jgi:hypothetical protein
MSGRNRGVFSAYYSMSTSSIGARSSGYHRATGEYVGVASGRDVIEVVYQVQNGEELHLDWVLGRGLVITDMMY